MKKIIVMLSVLGLALMVAGPAQAACYKNKCNRDGCSKVTVSPPFYNPGGAWWIPNHYPPHCGAFVPGYRNACLPGYRLGCNQVFIPAHYSKSIGWVPARVTYEGYFR